MSLHYIDMQYISIDKIRTFTMKQMTTIVIQII